MTVATMAFVSPMLVSRGPLPSGPGWAYEVKWDGLRGQAAVPSRARGAAPRRKPAPRGQTQAKVLAALAGAPGSSAAAVAKASGVSSNVAAATLSRLVKQGRVQRLDGGGYAVVEAAGAQPRRGPVATAEAPPEPTSGEQPPSPGIA